MNLDQVFLQDYTIWTNMIVEKDCLAPCEDTPQEKKVGCPAKSKKGNTPMRYYDEYNDVYVDAPAPQTDDAQKRTYLTTRIYSVQSDKGFELRKTFGLLDDDAPDTAKEFIKRIQDGKFVLKKETEDKKTWRPSEYITWRDPAVKEDQAGFDAAWETFSDEVTKVTDTVKIADPADGLKALQALEAWKPTA